MNKNEELNVHLYITPFCNLKCKHCYYDSKQTDEIADDLLSVDEIKKIIINLFDLYNADIHMEGGEIFLRNDMEELLNTIPARYWKYITVTTNGTVKIKFDINQLRKIGTLRVSVCGHTNEMQKVLRGIPLNSIMDNLHILKKHDVPVTLRITLHKENYDTVLSESIDYFYNLGFKSFELFEFQATGRGKQYVKQFGLMDEDVQRILYSLDSLPELDKLKLSFGSCRESLVKKYTHMLENEGYKLMYITAYKSLTINYNGDTGICPWQIGSDIFGRINEDNIHNYIVNDLKRIDLFHTCDHCTSIIIRK